MKSTAREPRERAPRETAWAWLPALAATTPTSSSASVRAAIRLRAPRILNDPARCRFSALSATFAPTRLEISPAETTGVMRTSPRIVSAARSISATPTALVLGKVAMGSG